MLKTAVTLRRQTLLRLSVCVFLLGAVTTLPAGASAGLGSIQEPLPWEDWRDLHRVAQLRHDSRVELRSSFCMGGCRFDRHSEGNERFLTTEADEGVIFDETGPGAITRIWMTSGDGTSLPLSTQTRIRFYFDDEATPTIDLPLRALFDGSVEPFTSPLAEQRTAASGGNYSVVPLPYRERCRVTLSNLEEVPLWFQFHFHRGRSDLRVESFDFDGLDTSLAPLRTLLSSSGEDPWPTPSGTWVQEKRQLGSGGKLVISSEGPATITAVQLRARREQWDALLLTFNIDGVESSARASDVFASPTEKKFPGSLFLSRRTAKLGKDSATLFLPIPHRSNASVTVQSTAPAGATIAVTLRARIQGGPVDSRSGTFQVATVTDQTEANQDLDMFVTQAPTKWVGVYADLSSKGASHPYLEGDERIFLDQGEHPALYGTGTEDIYAGGFYFDHGPYSHGLSGMLEQSETLRRRDVKKRKRRLREALAKFGARPARTVMYRWMLSDAPTSRSSLNAKLEAGPTGELPMTARHTNFFYTATPTATDWRMVDAFAVGERNERLEHNYQASSEVREVELASQYEGNPGLDQTLLGLERGSGKASFKMDASLCGPNLRLRRVYDAALEGQSAKITVNPVHQEGSTQSGAASGRLPFSAPNALRRWAEADLDFFLHPFAAHSSLDERHRRSVLVTVDATPDNDSATFTEYRWELWCDYEAILLEDGFESGNVAPWN